MARRISALLIVLLVGLPASMGWAAFPQVQTVSNGDTAPGTSHTLTLPTSIASGDLLIAAAGAGDGDTPSITWPGGWTGIYDCLTNDSLGRISVAYRVANGGEGASISVTTGSSTRTSYVIYRITGHNSTAPAVGTCAPATGTSADPPALTPSWGAKDTLWFAVLGYADSSGARIISAYPANYTNGIDQDVAISFTGMSIGSARRELNAGSENPGAFTVSDSVTRHTSNTIAVEPSGGAAQETFGFRLRRVQ